MSQLKKLDSPIFTIQENYFITKGKIKIEGYNVFEAIRTNKNNGGTAIRVIESLKPVLIE